jgi:hypothetical protein
MVNELRRQGKNGQSPARPASPGCAAEFTPNSPPQFNYAPTRRGIVNEYSTTTAPPAIRLHGAQSGGFTTFWAATGWFAGLFRTAWSINRASAPRMTLDTPSARKRDRNMRDRPPPREYGRPISLVGPRRQHSAPPEFLCGDCRFRRLRVTLPGPPRPTRRNARPRAYPRTLTLKNEASLSASP